MPCLRISEMPVSGAEKLKKRKKYNAIRLLSEYSVLCSGTINDKLKYFCLLTYNHGMEEIDMADSNETIIRLLQIMHTTDEKSPLNAPQIIEIMRNLYRQKMGRDTVYKGIQTLQYCGYDIKQCSNRKLGWYMANHEFEDWQLKIMHDSIMQARCITQEDSANLRRKLMNMTSTRGAAKIRSAFEPVGRNVSDDQSLGRYIDLMLEAIHTKKKVTFQYTELDPNMNRVLRKEGKWYELSIYSLYWSNDIYYVIGGHQKRLESHELTNYRLDRMENLHISEEPMIPMKEFLGDLPEYKLQDYINKQVNHYSGEEVHLVLEFDYEPRTMAILADFAGMNVKLTHLENGKLRAFVTKMDSEALRGWLLKYMTRFKIVEPQTMRNNLVDVLKLGVEMYQV